MYLLSCISIKLILICEIKVLSRFYFKDR